MPETIHILLDSSDEDPEGLQLGLDDLLTNQVGLKFCFYTVNVDEQWLHEKVIDTTRKKKITPRDIDEIENRVVLNNFAESRIFYKSSIAPPQRPRISWEDLFTLMPQFRAQWDIPRDQMAILLTPHGNEPNWFSTFRSIPTPDAFIQTTDWEYFLQAPRWYPIAQQLWTIMLQWKGFGSLAEMNQRLHREPRGCLNDRCDQKSQITLKMRTADVCPECTHAMLSFGLPRPLLMAAIQALEKIRLQSRFIQNVLLHESPSRLQIDQQGLLYFPDYEQLVIKLAPIEKTLYLFFARHPEGVGLNEISDYKEELVSLYLNMRMQEYNEAMGVISRLVNPLENSIYEKISRINAKLKLSLNAEVRYRNYLITYVDGRYRIPLSEKLLMVHTG